MMITNSFRDLAGDLEVFTPKLKSQIAPAPTMQQLERVGQEQGFTVDNLPVSRRLLKSGRVASKDKAQPMTLRIRVADWNRFSGFCERNGFTVAEGFEKLSLMADQS